MSEIVRQLREEIISNNVDFLKDKLFFEFGVFQGESLSMFYDLYKIIENYNNNCLFLERK